MPPGPAYNWFCVLSSVAEILGYAARHRAAQVPLTTQLTLYTPNRQRQTKEPTSSTPRETVQSKEGDVSAQNLTVPLTFAGRKQNAPAKSGVVQESLDVAAVQADTPFRNNGVPGRGDQFGEDDKKLVDQENSAASSLPSGIVRNLKSSKVPSSRIGRLFHYGGLAASLGYGAAAEIVRRTGSGKDDSSSVIMSEANIKRLVSKLVQMRGAALKLGQFMSIQDTHVLSPEVDRIFRQVQDSAHYMPDWQMEQVMTASFGSDWLSNFRSFDRIPFAAASIGQVHNAILAASVAPTKRDERVAVKVQFPNISHSIESDLGYIKLLLTAGKLLPKGLFLDKTIQVMSGELADECDYRREASFLRTFRSPKYLGNDPRFKVPWVWDGSTSTVLVMERVEGISVGEASISNLNQDDKNKISAWVIELCLKELFDFRTMQTDPNWTNFLWNTSTCQINLVDFGATREYSKGFMDNWFYLLRAAVSGNRTACIDWSLKLGYLTGEETETMVNAHVDSMMLLATPFKPNTIQPFSFGKGTIWEEATAKIRAYIPVMLQHRLTPPPQETYSLNRKLSGAFLLASRLGATVDTRALWEETTNKYKPGFE